MKLVLFLFALGLAYAQSNQMELCDQQASYHCLTWTVGPTLLTNFT